MNVKVLKTALWPTLAVLVGLFVLLEGEARKHPSYLESRNLARLSQGLLQGSADSAEGIRPEVSVTHGGLVYETTKLGTRGPMPLNEGFPVVVVAGDSYSWGWGVEVHKTWPERMRQRMERQMHFAEVFNASVPDSSPTGQVARLKFMSNELEKQGKKPTALILGHTFHEPELRLYRFNLALPVVLKSKLNPTFEPNIQNLLAENQEGSKRWAQSEKAYRKLGEFCRSEGLKCALVALLPVIEGAENLAPAYTALSEIAESAGLLFIGPTKGFDYQTWYRSQNSEDLRPNEEGHDQLATLVAHELRHLNVVPKTTLSPSEIREQRIKLSLERARQVQNAQSQ